jgi:hypothetical protein
MLHHVNVDTRTKGFVEAFTPSALNDFIRRKIYAVRPFAVKKGGGNPNFIGDFDLGENLLLQRYLPAMNYHHYKVEYTIPNVGQEKS